MPLYATCHQSPCTQLCSIKLNLLLQCRTIKCNAEPSNAMQNHQMQCRTIKCNAEPSNAMQNHQMQCRTIKCNAEPSNAMQNHQMQCRTIKCNAEPSNAMQNHQMQCRTIKCNAGGASTLNAGEHRQKLQSRSSWNCASNYTCTQSLVCILHSTEQHTRNRMVLFSQILLIIILSFDLKVDHAQTTPIPPCLSCRAYDNH